MRRFDPYWSEAEREKRRASHIATLGNGERIETAVRNAWDTPPGYVPACQACDEPIAVVDRYSDAGIECRCGMVWHNDTCCYGAHRCQA